MPTLAGFVSFVQNVMGISTTVLPADSPVIGFALSVALAIVNPQLALVYCGPSIAGVTPANIYTLAVYNLAGSQLLSYAQDQPDAAPVKGSNPPQPFFEWTRAQWNILAFISGVVDSTGDESTNVHLVVMDAAKQMTFQNLQQAKDPYGRQYLAFVQSAGPTVWGIS